MSITDGDGLFFSRETKVGTIRKEKSVDQDYSRRGRYSTVETLTYRRQGLDGSSRNLTIDEDGDITLHGKQPINEAYGLEDEIFSYQISLSDLDRKEVADQLVYLHEEEMYDELDEILHSVEEKIFDVR